MSSSSSIALVQVQPSEVRVTRKRDHTEAELDDLSAVFGLSGMCALDEPSLWEHHNGHDFFDDNTGDVLDANLVAKGCKDELDRFEKIGVS